MMPDNTDYNRGGAVALGIIEMFHAIREKLWDCSPRGGCHGQNFLPKDEKAPWTCWVCGKVE